MDSWPWLDRGAAPGLFLCCQDLSLFHEPNAREMEMGDTNKGHNNQGLTNYPVPLIGAHSLTNGNHKLLLPWVV
jgi:hypothetical protein